MNQLKQLATITVLTMMLSVITTTLVTNSQAEAAILCAFTDRVTTTLQCSLALAGEDCCTPTLRESRPPKHQKKLEAEAKKRGISVEQLLQEMREQKTEELKQYLVKQRQELEAEAKQRGITFEQLLQEMRQQREERMAQLEQRLNTEAERLGVTPEELMRALYRRHRDKAGQKNR